MSRANASSVEETIEQSAAPAAVRVALDRLQERIPDAVERLADDPALAAAVVAVTAASRSLTRLLTSEPGALDVLAGLDRRIAVDTTDPTSLVRTKQFEYLRIGARDLTGIDDLEATGAALAALAAHVLDGAWRLAGGGPLAVIGMGKLGGAELNYASDVDVMLVAAEGDPDELERQGRTLLELARGCFRVDANLRPEGRDGPLTRSVDSYRAYWERWAKPWEFQALLKARPVAGDAELGARFTEAATTQLWQAGFDADDLRSVRAMKERAEADVARRGLSEREVKRGRGGIRDIEFAVQLLQLVHGPVDAELRSPTTLTALAELAAAGYVDPTDAAELAAAYRFLRRVEHRLQLVDEQQVHTLPTDPVALGQLARVLGYRGIPDADAVEQLEADLRRHRAAVRAIHERLYFRPLLEAFAGAGAGALTPEAAETRLAAFGFTDVARTRQALRELTRGLTRSSRMMQQLLPLLLDWLSSSPDPDLGLLGLRTLASGEQRSTELAVAFRESPEVARRLCCLLGTSRLLVATLAHNPDLIATLAHVDEGGPAGPELMEGSRAALAWRPDPEDRRRALKRFTDREGLRIAAADVLDGLGVEGVGAGLTRLAEAVLESALTSLEPGLPLAVVAMGRFGGGELSYASDLDVLFVYDGDRPSDFEEAERLATALLRFVSSPTGGGRIYDLDVDLRPEGKQGPLARSLDGFHTYFERWAQTWEGQAMIRARPVAGDHEVGQRFLAAVEPFVWRDQLPDEDRREIRRMKARVEQERIPPGEDAQFHLKLGKGSLSDVEFCAQLLQLEHGVRAPATMAALDALAKAGALSAEDHDVLATAYRFCERTRNRWFLVNGGPGDSLPQQPERLARLARSLDTTAAALRDDYRRITRRSRAVVERLFYGK